MTLSIALLPKQRRKDQEFSDLMVYFMSLIIIVQRDVERCSVE